MKLLKRPFIVALLGAMGAATTLMGQDATSTNSGSFWDRPPLYRSQELSLDLSGTGAVGQNTLDRLTGERLVHHVRLGAGVGGNFFLTRYFGVGVEASSESTHHSFVNNVAGDLIVRIPVGDTFFAPYGFAGGGREFESFLQWEGHLGAGMEFRLYRHFSLFVDGRYVFAETSQNYGLARAGLRFSF
jgi:hypothetical protein